MKNRSIGSVQDLGDGRYRLRVSAGFDDFGRRVQPSKVVTAKSETDAEKQLLKLYNETRGTSSGSDKTAPKTLGELYNEFKADHVSLLRPNTQGYYAHLWDKHLKQFEKTRLATCTPKTIRKLLSSVIVGDRTKQGVYGLLKTMFKFACTDNNYMSENPCEKIHPPQYKAAEKVVLSRSEISEVFALIQAETPERQLSFILAVTCGMRRGEIMALCWADVDVSQKTLFIRKSMARAPESGIYIGATKNEKSNRSLSIPDVAIDVLARLRNEQADRAEKLGDKWIDTDFVFKSWDGGRMDLDFPSQWWLKFRKEHSIAENVNFHALRHTAATYMIAANMPISAVSGVLGHAQISTTTDIYTHVIDDTKQAAINVMADLLTPPKNNM